ncbi:hypothetical protein SRHO_G00241090 [Serrasalmus rhombeus]
MPSLTASRAPLVSGAALTQRARRSGEQVARRSRGKWQLVQVTVRGRTELGSEPRAALRVLFGRRRGAARSAWSVFTARFRSEGLGKGPRVTRAAPEGPLGASAVVLDSLRFSLR